MISNGGEHLTSIIADKAGMDMQEAEEYKRTINFFEASEDNMIAQHVVITLTILWILIVFGVL